jgi:beta-glucanase (GH16 family)
MNESYCFKETGLCRWPSSSRVRKASQLRKLVSPILCAVEPLERRLLLSSAPAAPTGVLASNGTTPTDIDVTWNAVSGATSYQVWRNTSATTASATDINSNVSGTSFDDTSVTVGTTYFYWIVASNGAGNSGYSTIASATGGTMVFGDTFGSAGVTSAWGAFNATDPNNPNVIYTNTTPANSSSTNPTTMQIVSDSQATDGQALAMSLTPAPGKSGYYDSAEICTEYDPSGAGNSLEYGEIQARIKIPGGNNSGAIWPAFWLLGDDITSVSWPSCGEIDVMENDGSEPGTIFSTIHGPMSNGTDYNGGAGVGSSDTLSGGQDFYSSYHLFAVNWGPNSVTFSVDGQAFATLTPADLPSGGSWVFNGHPFYVILDVCEGAPFAPGTITSTQTMYVDYVRAYSFPAPTGMVASSATNSSPAHVTWAAVDGATSYEVWRNSSSNVSSATEIAGGVTGTSYNDTSATSGANYYYWTVAANASQTSGFSASVLTKLPCSVTLPSPPSNIPYDGTTDVTDWVTPTVAGVSGSPAPTGTPTLVYYSGTTPTGTPLSSSPVYLGTYTVVANYAGDNNYVSAQSAPVTFTINNPAGLATSIGAQYTITWTAGLPTLDVSAGTVTLSEDMSTTFANYALSIENGASVLLNSVQHVGQLQINGTGSLNVQSYEVIINYGSGSDPISTIAGYIKSGYNGGAWIGTGIISAAARAPTNGLYYGLGYADGKDRVVSGLSSGQIEIKYTLLGDANLDGLVNGEDFTILASNFNQPATSWDQGDFNYDGTVNGEDFTLLAANFNQSVSGASVASSAPVLDVPAAPAVASTTPAVTTSTIESTANTTAAPAASATAPKVTTSRTSAAKNTTAAPAVVSAPLTVPSVTANSTAAASKALKSKPVSVSKPVVSDTTNRKPKAPAVTTYAASIVTVPTSGATATPQNTNNKDAKFLADR